MRKMAFGILFTLFTFSINAQLVVNVKKYGAGTSNDDTRAFMEAVNAINQRGGNATLYIPSGKYTLNPQKRGTDGEPPYVALDILRFKNCKNITIKGEKGTIINFRDNLYYGAFKNRRDRMEPLGTKTVDYAYRVAIGHGMYFENCSEITVSDIEINGNNKNFRTGSEFGDVGFQIDNDGIFVKDSRNIKFSNLFLHHFGRDGMLIINQTPQGFNTPSQNISLSGCRFEYNGRQGFSWVGGSGLTATNCTFSYTGQGKFSSPPSAGLDLEPNWGYIVYNGKFVNCTFSHNAGVSLITDQGGPNSRKMVFENCKIFGNYNHALWIKGAEFSFKKCKIQGTFLFGYAAEKESEGTKFIECSFEEMPSRPVKYLIECNGAQYMRFEKCTFTVTQSQMVYVAGGGDDNKRTAFNDCTFIGNYPSGGGGGMFSTGAIFGGNTTFKLNNASAIGWNMESTYFGKLDRRPSNITVSGILHLGTYDKVIIGVNKSPVYFNLGNKGLMLINNNGSLTINEGSTLVLEKGGTLWVAPTAKLVVRGKIIAKEGSYLCIHTSAQVDAQSLKNISVTPSTNFKDNPAAGAGLSGCRTF